MTGASGHLRSTWFGLRGAAGAVMRPSMSNRSASDLGARSEILSIQYLRGLAATMVVMRHAFQELGFLGHPMGGGFLLGSAGVDVFFVISGFIMVWMVDTRPVGPLTFLWSRFTRVAPPYWIITGVVVVGLVVAPGMFGSSKLEARHALLSFLFLPAAHPTMGDAVPLYQPGWSLNYEMIFYVSFAALLVFASAMRLAMLWGLGTLIVAAGAFLSPDRKSVV